MPLNHKKKPHRVPLARILVGAIGVILLWRGVWDFVKEVPVIQEPLVSVAVGLLLLYFSHEYYREL